jgi:hypothetical protein
LVPAKIASSRFILGGLACDRSLTDFSPGQTGGFSDHFKKSMRGVGLKPGAVLFFVFNFL